MAFIERPLFVLTLSVMIGMGYANINLGMKMKLLQGKRSSISLRSCKGHIKHLREIPQFCIRYFFSPSDAHTPFLKSRLHYIMFLLFFVIYSVSPLKICADRTLKGLLQDSDAASIRIIIVERVLSLMSDRLPSKGLFSSDDADVEMMIKKKRALLRSFTLLFLLLMAVAAHVAAKLYLCSNLIIDPCRFRFSQSSEHINIADVYLSPHSGLSPPHLLS